MKAVNIYSQVVAAGSKSRKKTGVVSDDARSCISLIANPLKHAIKHNVALKPGLAGLCGISMASKINRSNIVERRAASAGPDCLPGIKGFMCGCVSAKRCNLSAMCREARRAVILPVSY